MVQAKVSIEVAMHIESIASTLEDATPVQAIILSCTASERLIASEPYPLPDEWYNRVTELSSLQRRILSSTMKAALYNRFLVVRAFRKHGLRELEGLPTLGVGRAAILKAFGPPLTKESLQHVTPNPGYL